ncbi:GNAT family N-acetyltransferase [Streptomyces sp. NPDC059850]|uniref:GNAT family N-acetyltransferase n=1 Tax=Streptomyces sp. NPDC059850 TaxID=3346970 RepID=UPI0036463AA4
MTMTVTVRDFRAADAAAVVEARRSAYPHLVTTDRTVAWEVASAPEARRYRLLVAEADGRVVGACEVGLFPGEDGDGPGVACANTSVRADARGRGAGSALVTAAEEYAAGLGAAKVFAWTMDEPAVVAFAERRGYRRSRSCRILRLDLATAALPPLDADALPDGVALRTAADLAGDPRPLYETDVAVMADEPGDVVEGGMPYAEWLARTWDHPSLDHELTSLAVVDGRVAAFSLAHTDGRGRYWSGMTGTLRAYRGRGLAKLAKTDSLHRARAAGCAEAFTGNDSENGPMLAINAGLGYGLASVEWRYVRELRH